MLENMNPLTELRAVYLKKRLSNETVSIPKTRLNEYTTSGWRLDRELTRSLRMTREKSKPRLLEDQMWVLMYRMGFHYLSGQGGAILKQGADGSGPTSQIDVVAIDDEVAVAIECKSSEKYAKRPQFSEEMSKHALIRGRFAQAVNSLWPSDQKRQILLIMMMSNIQLTDNDKARAAAENIVLMDDHDLQYYTALVGHLGPAARYQFLADMLPGKRIPGLAIRVPAVRTKMGGVDCFNFSISPEYLLKIAYVSHRAKGKGSDVNTYQRMISKGRLAKISQYITNGGIFPTNILINLEADRVQFERVKQEPGTSENGTLGWLDIRPTYKAAWVIDGQHRLFAYSGHAHAHRDRLAVLAFRGLSPSTQAELFIDINTEQKSVKQSLLQELYAELHWDAEQPGTRVLAIISKTVLVLDQDRNSPFFQRIKTADAERDPKRCITYASLDSAIGKAKLHIVREKNGQPLELGPLWAGDNDSTLQRTVYVISEWFNAIRRAAEDWWDKGADEGGGLAMNDGVTSSIMVLRSVFDHLQQSGVLLGRLTDQELFEALRPYAEAAGNYYGSLMESEKRRFRELRGVQGQTTNMRRCQAAIRKQLPSFDAPGLDQFIQSERAQTNVKAKVLIDRMETTLQRVVVSALRDSYGEANDNWWTQGVPKAVRVKATERQEQDDNKRGARENYLELLDYRRIAIEHWDLFEDMLAFTKAGSKDRRTLWMVTLNDRRNVVAHPSSGITLTVEELGELEDYDRWLHAKVDEAEESNAS